MSTGATAGMIKLVTEEVVAPPLRSAGSATLSKVTRELVGRTVWHVNTTALGGGVAELLRTTVPRHTAAGVKSRWLVTRGTPEFFVLTKQLHHMLHGMPGGKEMPTKQDAQHYAVVTTAHAEAVRRRTRLGDIVVLHDPQTLGLAPVLKRAGLHVIWRCHIGTRRASPFADAAWRFLGPYIDAVNEFVFSSAAYVPPVLAGRCVSIIPPAINSASPKCRPMLPQEITAVLCAIGLQGGGGDATGPDLTDAARVFQDEPLLAADPTVVQISRWDPLKDMRGVLEAFAEHIADSTSAHLVLAGPDPDEVADDLENRAVLDDVIDALVELPTFVRRRVHLVVLRLGMRDANALIVNALQRRATVVVQKSMEEGFGLAVTEAMYKCRPVVAAAVGGLLEQMTDREHGLLVPPHDYAAFSAAVCELLDDPVLAAQLGAAAGSHCERTFLMDREDEQYAQLFLRADRASAI